MGIFRVDEGWWFGSKADGTRSGLFPAPYVTLVEAPPNQPEKAPAAGDQGLTGVAQFDYEVCAISLYPP